MKKINNFNMTNLAENPKKNAKVSKPKESGNSKTIRSFFPKKEKILVAQDFLRNQGFESVENTAKLDRATPSALRSFQRQEGLAVSATLDLTTFERIEFLLSCDQEEIAGSAFEDLPFEIIGNEPVFHFVDQTGFGGRTVVTPKAFSLFAFEEREDFLVIGGGLLILSVFLIIAFY